MLSAGTRLGPYEVVAPLGAGGMGEVYKARDTRLDRVVAIKVLSATLLGDPEFRERFEREARTISQLTHPHICVLHDIGRYEDTDYLVMEFLDGETLSARIDKGPLKLEEALRMAVQIARALYAAHRAGIVHRDLKPGNVMLTKMGAKLLDFGLAKQSAGTAGRLGAAPESARLQASLRDLTSPLTVNSPLTMRGSIVGTLQYMAPEQLEGGAADARSDIFAFGALLYEMVSGKKAFSGKSQVSVMAAILDHDPPSLIALQPSLPAALDRLIRKCLAKDPEARWQNAGDVASELEWIGETAAQPAAAIVGAANPAVQRSHARAWIAAAVTLPIVAAVATWAMIHVPASEKPLPVRFTFSPGGTLRLSSGSGQRDLAISPDGTHIAYTVGSTAANSELWVRAFDQLDAVQLQGLKSPQNPFFSPDSKWIAFGSLGELKKISVNGGPSISLCRMRGVPRGASWGPDSIVFATSDPNVGLFSVPAAGGEPKALTTPDPKNSEAGHMFPSFLPGGNAVLFTITTTTGLDNAQVAVLDLKSGQRKIVIRGGTHAEYVKTGHLVYAAGGSLRAVRFDPVRLEVLSDPIPVVEQLMTKGTGAAQFSVSDGGALVYVVGGAGLAGQGAPRSLVWVDRTGHEESIKAPVRAYFVPRLSPDGTQVALDIRDREHDIWTWDFSHETLTRITKDPADDMLPVWTTDGRRILFGSTRNGVANLYAQAADGTGVVERLSTSPNVQIPLSVTPGGTEVVVRDAQPSGLSPGMGLLRLDGASARGGASSHAIEPLIHSAFREDNGVVSPDGHWIAYESDESGQLQVYARPFPRVNDGLKQISSSGGSAPLWAPSGRELFYLDGGGTRLMAVAVTTSTSLTYGTPTKLFDVPYLTSNIRTYDVSRDGRKFLFIKDAPSSDQRFAPPSSLVVVLNWFEELRARVPTK